MTSPETVPSDPAPATEDASSADCQVFEVHLHGALDTPRMLAALEAHCDVFGETSREGSKPGNTPSQWLEHSHEHFSWSLTVPTSRFDRASFQALWQALAAHYGGQPLPAFASPDAHRQSQATLLQTPEAHQSLEFFQARAARSVETHRFYHSPAETTSPSPRLLRLQHPLGRQLTEQLARHLAKSTIDTAPDAELADNFFQTVLLATLRRLGGNREQALGVARRYASPPFEPQSKPPFKLWLGNFTHWAALCIDMEDADSFADLAARVQLDSKALHSHTLVDHNALPTPDSPTFEVTLHVEAQVAQTLPGVTITQSLKQTGHYRDIPSSTAGIAAVALTVSYAPDGSDFQLQYDFDRQRFSLQDAERFTKHTERLIEAATHDWQESIANALLISDAERQQLLALNPEDSPVGPDVIDAFEAQVERRPEHRALRFDGTDLSYCTLNQRANQLAHALSAAGVQSGDWVALVLERGVDLVASLLAILKLGAAYVPLDPSHPAARNALVLDVAQPKVVLTQHPVASELTEMAQCQVLCVEELLQHSPSSPENPERGEGVEEKIAYVIFTSGSTGKPKGVQVQRRALANFLSSMQEAPGFGEEDALLSVTTISFDIAALEVFLPLVSGGWLEMVDRLTALNPRELMTRLDSGDFSILQATPATWRMLIESNWEGTPTLKALCGGEALPPALAQQLCARTRQLWNMYGPTETTIWSTLELVQPTKKGISIGKPIANTQIYLLDDQQGLVPQGVIGELTIGGQGVTRGYAGLPDLTAEKFLSDPFHPSPDARMYRTGDLGRWLADGTLECLGRVDFQVKIRGFRIELGEIESAIAVHGSLPEALVVARELTPGDPRLVAYGKSSPQFDAAALREFLHERLPGYMVPSFFVPLDQWPLTPNGKIDRKALPEPDDSHRAAHEPNEEPPATELECRIAEIWCSSLNTPSIGRRENLFAAGGSSLDAIRLLTALASLPEGEVALGTFLQDPTVAGIADALTAPTVNDEPVIVSLNQVETTEEMPAIYCVCGIHLYSELAYSMPQYPVVGIYLPVEREILEMDESKPGVVLPTVEELATLYIEAIAKQQPQGPYLLAGVSFGGVLVYEMAQQLRKRGQTVTLLAMFDSLLSESYHFHFGSWLSGHLQKARSEGIGYVLERPSVARRLARVPALQRGVQRLLRQTVTPPPSTPSDSTPPGSREQEDTRIDEMRGEQLRVFDQLVKRYEPNMQKRSGDALFFRAMNDEQFPGYAIDGDGGWRRWIQGKLAVHTVPGSHLGILQGDSAQLIASRLLEAIAQSSKTQPSKTQPSKTSSNTVSRSSQDR